MTNQNVNNNYYQPPVNNSRQQIPGQRQYNDTLTPVCNFGFAFNHLLTVALVQRTPPPNLQKPDIKEKFFFFVTLAPGIGDNANRTYDFQNGKINQKFAIREIAGLSEILKQCAIGNDINVLPYTKFSRSNGGSKNLSVWISQKQQKIGNANNVIKCINLSVAADQIKHSITLNAEQALGMSKVLDKLFDKAMELELQSQQFTPPVQLNTQPISFSQFNPQNTNTFNQNPLPVYNNQVQIIK